MPTLTKTFIGANLNDLQEAIYDLEWAKVAEISRKLSDKDFNHQSNHVNSVDVHETVFHTLAAIQGGVNNFHTKAAAQFLIILQQKAPNAWLNVDKAKLLQVTTNPLIKDMVSAAVVSEVSAAAKTMNKTSGFFDKKMPHDRSTDQQLITPVESLISIKAATKF